MFIVRCGQNAEFLGAKAVGTTGIVFKHPVALIYHLIHIYFRLKCNLLYSHPSSTLHGSAVYSHHQVSSDLLK
jgi:hypothetical protein